MIPNAIFSETIPGKGRDRSPSMEVVSIQMLRGIAATMVVLVHIDHELERLHYARLYAAWLSSGVDIFFVISGFIMWTSVHRRPTLSATQFLRNRIVRIVPLYWATTTLVLVIAFLAPQLMKTTVLEPSHVLASYMFLPARHPTAGVFWPLLVPGWSLNFEMFFYAVFGIALLTFPKKAWLRFLLISAMLLFTLMIASLTKNFVDAMNFYANPILLEFVAGMALGVIFTAEIVRPSRLWLTASAVGFCILAQVLRVPGGFSATILASTMIVSGAIFSPPFRHNPLSVLGDASYSLYLTHIIPISAAALICEHFFPSLGAPLFMFFSVALALTLAIFVHHTFEVPVTRRLKRRSGRAGVTSVPTESGQIESHGPAVLLGHQESRAS